MRRLFTVHPKYFDKWGLCVQWRDTLFYQSVFLGKKRDTWDNPDYARFLTVSRPLEYLGAYLWYIADFAYYSATNRTHLPKNRIEEAINPASLTKLVISPALLEDDFNTLQRSVALRNPEKHQSNLRLLQAEGNVIAPHPLFVVESPLSTL